MQLKPDSRKDFIHKKEWLPMLNKRVFTDATKRGWDLHAIDNQ